VKHSCYFWVKTSLKFVSSKNIIGVSLCPAFQIAPFPPTLRTQNLTILNTLFYFWTPNYRTKVPPDLFYGEICWTKLSFSHSESEFVWEVPLGFKITKFWKRSFISGPQITKQKCHQIYSTVKLVEQNFHFPILSWNL
jgi:hypothetical protein